MPRQPSSMRQEINYETLPAFCTKCNTQGHNIGTCKLLVKDIGKKKESGPVWKPQKPNEIEKVVVLGGNRPSVSGEPVGDDLAVKENNFEAKYSGVNKEVAVTESEKTGTYGGEEGLTRSEEGLSKDQFESMEKNDKSSTEMRCAELIIEGAALEVNTSMDCMMKSVEIGGDYGNSGGAGMLNGEKEYDPISINDFLDGVILENLDDNVEELAKENLGWRRVEKAAKPVMRSSGSISDSEGIGVLPHFAKEKDGVSDTEILKPKLRSSMKLRSSSQAPSRPEQIDQC
jgi:hypothetical protein